MNKSITNYLNVVLNYQDNHSTRGECVSNSMILYDYIQQLYPDKVKVVTGILRYEIQKTCIVVAHTWIELIGKRGIIECSLEFRDLPENSNPCYFSISEFLKYTPDTPQDMKIQLVKKVCALDKLVTEMKKNHNATNYYYKDVTAFIRNNSSKI